MATSGRRPVGLPRKPITLSLFYPTRLTGIGSAWVYFFLPEVKDRSLEEIDEMVSHGTTQLITSCLQDSND